MKEFLKFALQCLLIAVILKNCLKEEPRTATSPNPPTPEVTAKRVVPPPPRIISPVLEKKDENLAEKVWSYFQGPCHPILPAFKAAHDEVGARSLAAAIIEEKHSGPFNLAQVCDVYDYLRENWLELEDPNNRELVAPAPAVLEMPAGDCDDFCVALSAAISSVNGVTRVTFAYDSANRGHAYTEVCLGKHPNMRKIEQYLSARYDLPEDTEFNTRTDQAGYVYLNLDWSAPYPGGPYFDAIKGVLYWPGADYCVEF